MEIQTLFKFCLTVFLPPERPGRLDTGHSNIVPTLFSFISFIHTLFLLKSSFRLCSTVVQIQTFVCVSTGSQTQFTFCSVFVHIQTLFSICSHSLHIGGMEGVHPDWEGAGVGLPQPGPHGLLPHGQQSHKLSHLVVVPPHLSHYAVCGAFSTKNVANYRDSTCGLTFLT